MAWPERPACDRDVRDRVTADLGTTYFLEAGAGTGKTKVLVDRYVRCVLDPGRGAGDVRQVAAITFTEKAAGELRQRIREEFEQRAAEAAPGSAAAAAVQRALAGLDDAPVSTIHGFAGRLLRESPVEAGIDPAFEQLDGLAAEIGRARLWEEWLTGLAAGTAGADGGGGAPAHAERVRPWLARLLGAGVTLDTVRSLAIGPNGVFGERYDIDPVAGPPPEPDLAGGLAGLGASAARLAGYCAAACTDHTDKGCAAALALADACAKMVADPPADADAFAAALYGLPAKETPSAPGGAKANWNAGRGGKDGLQARYREVVAEVVAQRDAYAAFLAGTAIAVADAFSRWAGGAQVAQGRLDFTDLLGRLRDLLAGDLVARGELQRRFRFILVDEFQDTDPLQAEIALFLCEREPVARDWRDVVLEPGKLFVVGDPKQSIYRFRRADIALYDEVKHVVAGQPGSTGRLEHLTQNFRTTPEAVDWINQVFAGVFDDDATEGRQPGYTPLEAFRPRSAGEKVAVLLGREYGSQSGEADEARGDEARALAALLLEVCGPGAACWQIQDRGVTGDRVEATRAPRWGDVALLFRATTGHETYEQALRAAGVPYRVEGGKAYFGRREVADALLCLRAADDPSDGPALYGALHSSYFGFSDDDLVRFWAQGGRFDLDAAGQPPGHDPVVAALRTLRDLHERRGAREPHELVAELVRLTRMTESLAATGAGAGQAIANLEKLVERARAFTAAGGGGLGAFLEWAAEAGDAAGERESAVGDDEDVVHLLTVHKAKGLEFPIVVVVGGALAGGGGGGEPIVDRARRRLAARLSVELPGRRPETLEPAAYTALKVREKEMEASESRRLLYVAATRARDRLVLTCFGRLAKKDGTPAAVLLGPLHDVLPSPGPEAPREARVDGDLLVLAPAESSPRRDVGGSAGGAELARARAAWLERRRAVLARAGLPAPATSPSLLEHMDDDAARGGPGAPPGRARALALGSAVHRVMELCDLADPVGLEDLADAVVREFDRPDLAGQAAALAGACWRSAPVRAAATADEVYRELPVGALIAGAVVGGAIDLLYRDAGGWVVVDYKTDADADEAVLRERYLTQGAAYALAIEAATGQAVRDVVFVAAAADGLAVTTPVDDVVRELGRRAVTAAVGEGRAVEPWLPSSAGPP